MTPARITQLIARAVAFGLTALAAYYTGDESINPETLVAIDTTSQALASGIGAVLMLAIDFISHRKQNGTLGDPRKHANLLLLLLAFLIVPACGQLSASRRYQIASDTHAVIVTSMTELSKADLVDLDDLERFDTYRKKSKSILDRFESGIISANNEDVSLLPELTDYLATMAAIEKEIRDGHRADHRDSDCSVETRKDTGGSAGERTPRADGGGDRGHGHPPSDGGQRI